MPASKNPTNEQLEKLIKEADKTITRGIKWISEWDDYRNALINLKSGAASETGTTPSGPVPPTPPGVPRK